jgi:hypothetical protein
MNRKGNFEDLATAQVSRAQSRRKRLAPFGGGIGAVRQNRNFWTGKLSKSGGNIQIKTKDFIKIQGHGYGMSYDGPEKKIAYKMDNNDIIDFNRSSDAQKIKYILSSIKHANQYGEGQINLRQLFSNLPKDIAGVNIIADINIDNSTLTVYMNFPTIYENLCIDIYPSRIIQVGPFNSIKVNGIIKEGYWMLMEFNRAEGNIPMLIIETKDDASFDVLYNYLFN